MLIRNLKFRVILDDKNIYYIIAISYIFTFLLKSRNFFFNFNFIFIISSLILLTIMQLRQKINDSFNKIYRVIPGGVFGLIAMSFGLAGIFIPLLFYPSYNIYVDMISHLGTPWKSTAYIYFDIFLFFSGMTNIPFVFYIGRVFKQEIGESKWIKTAVIWNGISSICLMFVGLFLSFSLSLNDIPFILHGFSAIVMFSGVAIYCFIYSNLIIKNKDKFPIILAIIGYIVAGMQLAFLFSWYSYMEWYATMFLMGWIIIMSIYTLYKKY